MPVLVARLQKYVEYTRAFHLLERSFFCEGVTNKKTHFSRARSLRLHGPARFALLRDPFRKLMPSPPLHSERKNHPLTVPLPCRSPFLPLGSIWGSIFSEFSAKILQPRLHNSHKYRPPSVPCPSLCINSPNRMWNN